jgi:formate hydrogenlyase subunit 3/multisubunit Na+/H+ antiporter MnhD subunit
MQIKISQRIISILKIILLVLILLSGFGWLNSMVSYKYEVQDTLYAGKPLDEHQKQIIYYISSSKIELIICVVLFVFILFINIANPTFNGRVFYVKKGNQPL